jgi:NADH-ubiquinone oxidoreductase chain 2
MIIFAILFILLSNAVTLRRDKSILFSRVAILALLTSFYLVYTSLYISNLASGIGIYGGLFHATSITHIFQGFIFLISAVILLLTGFYPRKVWTTEHSSIQKLLSYKFLYYKSDILNKQGEQFKIIEYPLILVFIVTGAIFLVSTSDLVSIFLSIELQSYGLYLLSTLYRNSELATSGGLTYFLLGGLSSCFILLGTSLLYGNSGTSYLDGIYVITSLSDISYGNGENINGDFLY